MKQKLIRAGAVFVLVFAAGAAGYALRGTIITKTPVIPTSTIAAPAANSVRVIYSLDKKQNDQELIALIDGAKSRIYFAIYTFTLPSIADALVRAKERGVDVRGVMDSVQSNNSYGAPITAKLFAAGIPVVIEKHSTGSGIMHIKALVTDLAYAVGSYNWTNSATTINDEILEIGTDPALRQVYENVLKRLFDAYQDNNAAAGAAAKVSIGLIDYTEAPAHIGEYANVRGTLANTYTSSSGTVFLDFCKNYKNCPFSGVIFADDAKKFGDFSRYNNKIITISGKISSYQDRAEIILSDPSQLSI